MNPIDGGNVHPDILGNKWLSRSEHGVASSTDESVNCEDGVEHTYPQIIRL